MRKSVVIITTSTVVVLILSIVGTWYFKPQLFTPIFKQLNLPIQTIPVVVVQGVDTTYTFKQVKNFPHSSEFAETITNLAEEQNPINIIITNDEKTAEIPFLKDKKIVSGFSFPDKKNITTITVYIAPEVQADQGALQYEITRNYLLALLYASEYKKVLLDPTYIPEYTTKQKLMHQITMDAVDQQQFPLVITKQ
jgi:hypothetical protein